MTFESGHDFFGDLGLGQGPASDELARAAAREAWPRLGALFLASRDEDPRRGVPWAFEAFGPPEEAAHAE